MRIQVHPTDPATGILASEVHGSLSDADAYADADFDRANRRNGLRWLQIGCVVGASMAFSFYAINIILPSADSSLSQLQLNRVTIGAILSAVALMCLLARQRIEAYYALLTSLTIFLVFGGIIIAAFTPRPDSPTGLPSERAALTLVTAIWLCSAFTRLHPLTLAAFTCTSSCLLAYAVWREDNSYFPALSVHLLVAVAGAITLSIETRRTDRRIHETNKAILASASKQHQLNAVLISDLAFRSQVLRAIGHDLRQPLASVGLYSESLRLSTSERVRGTGESIQMCLRGIEGTLHTLVAMANTSQSATETRESTAEISEMVDTVHSIVLPFCRANRIQILIGTLRDAKVKTNACATTEILQNLILNAAHHAFKSNESTKPTILLSATHVGKFVRLSVLDNGIGLPLEVLEALQQERHPVNSARSAHPESHLGIGLLIVRMLISNLPGHRLVVRTFPRKGTRFSLYVPLA